MRCEICFESKFIETFFHSIEKNNEPLSLIYLDIGDLKFVQTKTTFSYCPITEGMKIVRQKYV
jgi:hypothetical protein